MVKLFMVSLVLLLSLACGGGGGGSSSVNNTTNITYRVKTSDVPVFTGTWYAMSYILNGVESLPVVTKKCKIVFNSDGSWTSETVAVSNLNGFLIDTYTINSENNLESYVIIKSFEYIIHSQNKITIFQTFVDRTDPNAKSYSVQMVIMRDYVEPSLVGTYDIDINTYTEHNQNTILAYGYNSGYFKIESNGKCTVTFVKNNIPVSAVSKVVINKSDVNDVFTIYETYETSQSSVGSITKTNNFITMNLTYSDNSLTSFVATKR